MVKALLAAAVALPMAATGFVAATGVVVVDVTVPEGAEMRRIVVPVPLAVADGALAIARIKGWNVDLPEDATRHLPEMAAIVGALAAAPDGEFVRVEDGEDTVVVEKTGGLLHVVVHDHADQVDVRIPFDAIRAALPRDGRLDPSSLVSALRRARFTQLVDVHGGGGEHVRVNIY